MTPEPEVDINALFEQGTPIDEAMNEAVRDAIRRHREVGQPMADWRDGQVVLVMPQDIEIENAKEGENESPTNPPQP